MADFKLLGGTDPATNVVGKMTQGLGFPLREVDESTAGGTVTIKSEDILIAPSPITQQPASLDTPLQLTFGPAVSTGIVDVDAAGNFTFLEDDEFLVRLRLMFGRIGNPGVSFVFGRGLLNGVQAGKSVHAELDTGAFNVPATFEGTLAVTAGDVFTVEIMRSSAGVNEGGVFAEASPLAGWQDSPSAQVVISRSVAVAT